jgi:pimeloyl-ACP methyl ester carboxylesterase
MIEIFGRPMVLYAAEAVAWGIGSAVAFVVGTYVFAFLLTRGKFGFPGVAYFVRETLWVCITQPLLILGWLFTPRNAKAFRLSSESAHGAKGGNRPVVLIHGYTQNRTNFIWLSRALAKKGLGPFFGFDYASFRPIEESARKLHDFVEHIVSETGATEVDLICHSLGGIVARTYVDLMGGEARVRRVVTLGSPHRGVRHAHRVFGASIHDLRPSTGFIARLDGAEKSKKVAYHSIYSSHDNIVFPSSISSLGERGSDILVKRRGHFDILFSTEVADHVARALTEEGEQSARAAMTASSDGPLSPRFAASVK